MSTPNEDSIGHTPAWYRRQLAEAQNEIQRLRNALTLAQAEITTLRALTAETRIKDQAIAELTADRRWLTPKGMAE